MKRKQSEEKKVRPITMALSMLAGLLAAILCIPAFAGIWYFVAGEENIPTTLPSINLAILATALGAVILWFANINSKSKTKEDEWGARRARENTVFWGKSLVFSAFCFTIFGFLSPILGEKSITGIEMYDTVLKWIVGLSFMAGTISLIITVCYGMVFVWVRKL